MTLRACGTCRFYEPSAVWRQGWCRNARLYGPQESNPVDASTLDCESAAAKGLWEPANAQAVTSRHGSFASQARPLATAASGLGGGSGRSGGGMMTDGPGRAGSSEERTVSYQPEERYWTDYLRIALPVIGLLLLIGLLWYWASALIGDGGNQPPPTQSPQLSSRRSMRRRRRRRRRLRLSSLPLRDRRQFRRPRRPPLWQRRRR